MRKKILLIFIIALAFALFVSLIFSTINVVQKVPVRSDDTKSERAVNDTKKNVELLKSFQQNTLSLMEIWGDPWNDIRFYPSDCANNATMPEDLLNIAVKSIRGPDASAYSVEGFCQLQDGSIWINTSISILSDFWNLEGILLLLDKNGHLAKDIPSTCVSHELGYCEFLGIKDGNFFFQTGMGDGGGANNRVFVINGTGNNITLEETDDWLVGTTEPLSPLTPPCEKRDITVGEVFSIEKSFSDMYAEYGYQKTLTVQEGQTCQIANVKIIFFVTNIGEMGLAAIRQDDDSKVQTKVMMLPEETDFPQFIKLDRDPNGKSIFLATRYIDNEKHNFDVATFVINPIPGDYPLLDYESSHSIKANPEECKKIRCIELPFER